MVRTDAGAWPSVDTLLRTSKVGTAVFCVVAVVTAAVGDPLRHVIVAVSMTFFLAGCTAFLWAFAIAVERSRTDAIDLGGLFLLLGSAPRGVKRPLLAALAAQVVVAVATAAACPFTNQAFAVLAPMFGLGLMGLWGARFGQFAPRAGTGERR